MGEPLSALLGRLEQIGIGDLSPQEIASGPAEFERLAKGLEDTATSAIVGTARLALATALKRLPNQAATMHVASKPALGVMVCVDFQTNADSE